VLALALGGRTIAEWKESMEQPEFLTWVEFFKLYPFDDFHRYHRPAALVSTALGGGDVKPRLDWLQPEPDVDGLSEADRNTLKAFGFTRKGAAG
jgi:hypothetical protein